MPRNQHRDGTSHPDLDHFLEQRNDKLLPHRRNHNATNPLAAFQKDDRPIVVDQDPQTKKWRAYRRTKDGIMGRMVCNQVESREVANEYKEKEELIVPRTLERNPSRRASFGPPRGGWPDLSES